MNYLDFDLSKFFTSQLNYQNVLDLCEKQLSNKRAQRFFESIRHLDLPQEPMFDCKDGVACSVFDMPKDYDALKACVFELRPWRKGPFQLGELMIDSEWQCQIKWDRLVSSIDVVDKTILDIGCGNGYYLYRCLEKKARFALGLDPHLLYYYQFCLIQAFMPKLSLALLPLGWEDTRELRSIFDYVFCLGVLYHEKDPHVLLNRLYQLIRDQGEVILETLILADDGENVLVPKDRYACMKNVFHIPTLSVLKQWVKMAGFSSFEVVDIALTTVNEQRSTQWSSDHSLINFLDPNDLSKTIEGYPAPVRAMVKIS